MFTFGEQLYRLTSRDEETLLVEPYVRQFRFDATAAATTTFDVPIAVDRIFYIDTVIANLAAPGGVGAQWQGWQINLITLPSDPVNQLVVGNVGMPTQLLQSDGTITPTPVNAFILQTKVVKFAFPPGYRTMRFTVARVAGVAPIQAEFFLTGYTLPPGRVGRIS